MADLDITGSVTRTELGLADLAINEVGDDRYKIMPEGFGPGSVVWARQFAASPFAHGRFLTSAKKEQGTELLAIRVKGTSKTNVQTRMESLVKAFEQFEYNLTIIMEGITYTYACEPADYTIGAGGQFQRFHLMSYMQEVTFEIPRYPITVSGPF